MTLEELKEMGDIALHVIIGALIAGLGLGAFAFVFFALANYGMHLFH